MNYTEVFMTALTSLKSNKLRTMLTMLGIIIGILAVTLVLIISQGATTAITSKISSLGTNLVFAGQGPTGQLTTQDAQAIVQQIPDISAYSDVVSNSKQVSANGQTGTYTVQGVNPSYATMLSFTLQEGSFFTDDDVTSYASVAVLGSQAVTDLFGQDANPTGQYIQIGNETFQVIGTLTQEGNGAGGNPDTSIYIPVTTAMSTITGSNNLNAVILLAKDQSEVNLIAKEVKQLMLDRYNVTDPKVIQSYTVDTSQGLLTTINSITTILSSVLAGIAGISLLVGGIGIMNIMLVTVTERTKEIGLLKAIGAKSGNILTQFLIESVVLTVSGGIIGMLLGVGAGYVLAKIFKVPFTLPYFSIIGAVLVSIIIGLIFGIYPAQRAAKMNPIEALRYE